MNRNRLIGLGLAIAAGALVLILWPRQPASVEDLITQKVMNMVRAAEDKALGDVMAEISEKFRSEEGWSKDEVKGVMAAQLFRGNWVRIFPTGLKVTVLSVDEAQMNGTFLFGRSNAKQLAELARDSVMSAYEIEAKAQREADGAWRFVWARHRPVDGSALLGR